MNTGVSEPQNLSSDRVSEYNSTPWCWNTSKGTCIYDLAPRAVNVIPWSCHTVRHTNTHVHVQSFAAISCFRTIRWVRYQIGQPHRIEVNCRRWQSFRPKIIQHILFGLVFRYGQLSCLTRVLKLYTHTHTYIQKRSVCWLLTRLSNIKTIYRGGSAFFSVRIGMCSSSRCIGEWVWLVAQFKFKYSMDQLTDWLAKQTNGTLPSHELRLTLTHGQRGSERARERKREWLEHTEIQ